MIYTDKLPTSIDLSESFADYLQYDTVENLKNAFRQMERRFKGQPKKAQIAKGIARYVKEHPLEVLQQCDAETLMYIHKMIEMGKGSCITIDQPYVRGRQIQNMELVLTYDDERNRRTEFYLLDELHDIFAPHIAEAYKNPSPVLQADMVKGLEDLKDIAEGCKTSEEFITKIKEQFPELDLEEERGSGKEETNEEIEALLSEASKQPRTGGSADSIPYSFCNPLMKDVRDLHYKGQAAVCLAFHRMLQQDSPKIHSHFVERFIEDYSQIVYDDLAESIEALHHCINDMDSIIYDVDLYDPMTFFDMAARFRPIIRLSQEKWPMPKMDDEQPEPPVKEKEPFKINYLLIPDDERAAAYYDQLIKDVLTYYGDSTKQDLEGCITTMEELAVKAEEYTKDRKTHLLTFDITFTIICHFPLWYDHGNYSQYPGYRDRLRKLFQSLERSMLKGWLTGQGHDMYTWASDTVAKHLININKSPFFKKDKIYNLNHLIKELRKRR